MNLDQALEAIADYLEIDADALRAATAQDDFGGYHVDKANEKFPAGSIWGVEGQVLYALVRVLQPQNLVELGVYHGASSTHILAALQANGTGTLNSVDHHSGDSGAIAIGGHIPDAQKPDFHFHEMRAQAYLGKLKDASADLIFEDAFHDPIGTAEIWALAVDKLMPGGVIVSHDSEHFIVGAGVKEGVKTAGVSDYLSLLIEPSDCGLLIWQKPIDAVGEPPKADESPVKSAVKKAPVKRTPRKAAK